MFTLQYFCCHSSRSWQFTTLHSFATLLSLDFYQKYKHYKIQIQHRNIPLYSVTILTEAAPQRHVNTTLAKSHKFHLTLVKFSKKPRRELKLTSNSSFNFRQSLASLLATKFLLQIYMELTAHY